MSSYPHQNRLGPEAHTREGAGMAGSDIPIPRTVGIDLSQLTHVNTAAESFVVSPPVRDTRNDTKHAKPVKEKSATQKSPSKALKPKTPRKNPSAMPKKPKKTSSVPEVKREKKTPEINVDVSSFDFSEVPYPVCSCTGIPRVCYKWGLGGWQSSCCTIGISVYPLPMSSTRPRSRLAGRKMSNGAYVKLLLRLAGEGHDLSRPVDLKNHWARHGTNKFVTIK
ncbi:PREDICTED: protein BASIC PENTACYSTEINE7-like isoform X1 [Tarenaya hassleriana]|uniref:protein BASIC PENTACYSTEINE7-like isoform X1 n=1 Tax=Tarenaya hassleriana TaxID=28532 RepID=UPI0008FD7EF5|nr:PREDICTED: protein BASIC PENTACYSTEINE7-like isoform X1 [Tarenaya hassleriana]XP_019056259.1 PREDICTED: protein BASIC PENTACYSTEINE7-like isoform X1 [Tarenaya hassleriana]XP_019056260.1 PREDICTED: protein BASIC PENTACYSTEINE7-like isoform X1 [Tarenaya hassleriana]